MKLKPLDCVYLKDGHKAAILEVLVEDKVFLADVVRDGKTFLEEVNIEDIEKCLCMNKG